jgi:hypothetical protein
MTTDEAIASQPKRIRIRIGPREGAPPQGNYIQVLMAQTRMRFYVAPTAC